MKSLINRKLANIEKLHGQKTAYKLGKKILIALTFLVKISIKCLVFLFSFFVMKRGFYEHNDKERFLYQENNGPDDIWKLTSGNDYYKKEPPDTFS